MAFDMGWDFRLTPAACTDDIHWGVPVINEAYPHTYTNGDGQSVNAGWDSPVTGGLDDANNNDPRIVGVNYMSPADPLRQFHVDLSSGSAPGAGTYLVDAAWGQVTNPRTYTTMAVRDNTTAVVGPFSGTTAAGGHFFDATGTDITASTTWTGTRVSKTFASTNAYIEMQSATDYPCVCHFRLTLQAGGAAPVPPMIALAPPTPAGVF